MKYLLAFCFAFAVSGAQPVTEYTRFCSTCGVLGAESILSESGQFIVHGRTERAFPPLRRPGEPPLIELQSQIMAVSAERCKRALTDELGIPNTYQDKVHLLLLSRSRPDHPITVVSHIHSDGFQYQVAFPVYIESRRMIKGLVQTLLQEYANRTGRRNAELPSWLVEGMTRQLLSRVVPGAVVNRRPLTVERLGYDRLGSTRDYFQTNSPVTIQDLSFNNLEAMSPEERSRYEASAHLLVHELLGLRSGPALMTRFLQQLPHSLNWQTAFHDTYRQYFRTPLDFEKWWALRCVQVQQREDRETWTTPVSLERLDALLRLSLEYRVSSNAIPQKREASLQELLQSTDFNAQKDLLGRKLQQIFFLSVNLSDEVQKIAYAYEEAIDSYLRKRTVSDYQPGLRTDPEQRIQLLVRSAANTLDELDRARDDVRAGRPAQLPEAPKAPRKPGRQVIITRGNSQN